MNQANPDPPSKDAPAEFVGRKWLFQRVDDFLKQEQERYFVVTGEPGIQCLPVFDDTPSRKTSRSHTQIRQ